ncbi:MAG: hypothetical protein KatS3mg024_1170 [Armatimonadota bacterium]|nr:MAG: hypothetical protein KatS3mg024_1170 [Armatimonadota bacterium]
MERCLAPALLTALLMATRPGSAQETATTITLQKSASIRSLNTDYPFCITLAVEL